MTIALIIIVYVEVAVFVAICAAMIGTNPMESRRAQRNAARVGLLAMFWPVLAVYGLAYLIPSLVRRAGWVKR